ncbi:hypothetical protein MTO96_041134, partial [Rhipicephalus appendiculatus]
EGLGSGSSDDSSGSSGDGIVLPLFIVPTTLPPSVTALETTTGQPVTISPTAESPKTIATPPTAPPVPVTTTAVPVSTTSVPPTTTSVPVATTSVPPTRTTVQVTTTPVPVTTTRVAVTTTSVPATTTTVSVTTTRLPVTTTTELVTTTSVPATVTPSGANGSVCTTEQCHFAAQWLRQKLDAKVDPCKDFYNYVCGTFKSEGPDASIETKDLVDWMISIKMDLKNRTALAAIDPKDMMVRCSLDFGVHTIISIVALDEIFYRGKRALSMGYSENDEKWQTSRRYAPPERNKAIYVAILRLYGFDEPGATTLATSLSNIEMRIDRIVSSRSTSHSPIVVGPIAGMGQKTQPYITGAEWALAFAKNTNNIYEYNDFVLYTNELLDIITLLFKFIKPNGFSHLIAWSLFRQLLTYTDSRLLLAAHTATEVCYMHVKKVMNVAFAASYLHFGLLQHPFFNLDRPPAMNYGSVGNTIGHEMMHGYDANGIKYDADSNTRTWTTPEFLKKYTERVLCLRESHRTVARMRAQQVALNQTDAENLADLVGATLSYAAFSSLPLSERNVTLPGLNLTAEHLFFISHCVMYCESFPCAELLCPRPLALHRATHEHGRVLGRLRMCTRHTHEPVQEVLLLVLTARR